MCRLKRWPPKSPWRNIHSQEPRAPKSCSIRAPIRAPKSCSIRVPNSGPEKSYTIRAPKRWLVDTNVQIETVASKEPLEKHPQPRAPGPEKSFDSGPKLFHSGPGFGPRKVVYHGGHKCADRNNGIQRVPGETSTAKSPGPRKVVRFGPRFGPRKAVPRKDGWWTQMCRLKRWPPKSPWRNIHSQEPRAPKSCSIRAPIRAPKSCSFRVPDSGPEKLFDSGPDSGPEKLFHSGPGFGPRKAVPFGPRVTGSKLFSSWKNSPCWLRRLVQNLGRVQAPKLPQREQGTVAQLQRARTNLRTRSW